jgi:hypothetical protein
MEIGAMRRSFAVVFNSDSDSEFNFEGFYPADIHPAEIQ